MNEKIAAIQKLLGVTADGIWGPKSKAALLELTSPYPPSAVSTLPADQNDSTGLVDPRSEANIATLHPKVQPFARRLVRSAICTIRVTSGTRTYDQQNELYEQGRTKPGKIVTNARGGQSSHNFGTAFDITVFSGSEPVWDGSQYREMGQIGKNLGLSWGGDWGVEDQPHFYLKPPFATGMSESEMMAELRRRHANNIDAFLE